MKKKFKNRPSLLKPNKRVPIENRGASALNVTNKIRTVEKKKYLIQTFMGNDYGKFFK